MTIPVTLDYPTYTLKIPSTGKEVEFRPFIEKERKVLLMAAESDNDNDMLVVIKNIIKACCNTPIDVDKLTTFDVEYFFLHLRAKSIGEIVKLPFRCENVTEENKPCNNIMEVSVDITETELDKPVRDGLIKLSTKLAVKMNYPTFGRMVEYSNDPKRESIYGLIALCIEYIANDEGMYYAKDYSFEDMLEFVLSLNPQQFTQLEEFVEEMPSLLKKVNYKCKKCGYDHELILKGYRSFFL